MRIFAVSALFLLGLLPVLTCRADQFFPLTIETLSTNADLIIHGTVLSKTVQRDSDGRIFTSIEVAVSEVWKGRIAKDQITIVRGGGVLGDEGVEVSGEADYEIGEELVSFLVLNQRGEPLSLGMGQGKFHVWQDPKSGERLASNGVHGAGSRAGRTGPPSAGKPAILTHLSLAELKLRAQGGGK